MQFTKNSLVFTRQNIIYLPVTESTNTYSKILVSNSRPVTDGTVIMAGEQTAGRGQQHTSWHAQAGKNLTFSIINEAEFLPPSRQFLLSMAVALSVKDFLTYMGLQYVFIKWPNDVYVSGRKIAGILIENIIQGLVIKHSVSGIGLNVNQDAFPDSLATACSMKMITGKTYFIPETLELFLSFFDVRWDQLKSVVRSFSEQGIDQEDGYDEVQRNDQEVRAGADQANNQGISINFSNQFKNPIELDYLNSLLGLNQTLRFKAQGIKFQGIIRGVGKAGELILDLDGAQKSFWNKEIEFDLPV